MKEYIIGILKEIGEEPSRNGLIETPHRVAKMYEEVFKGYKEDPKDILNTVFEADTQDLVLVKDIPFYSHCEHHMVPFFGVAHVAYIPNRSKNVVGISKLARLVDCFAKRLQIQERLTQQVAQAIDDHLAPYGLAVIFEAEHLCMSMRGVRKPGAKTVTSHMRGIFKEDEKARQELMMLIKEG